MGVVFEPFSSEHRAAPYPVYRALRDQAPVHHAPEADVWCISRYDDVLAVLNDPETFSSEAMFSKLMNAGAEADRALTWNAVRFIVKLAVRARLRPNRFAGTRTLIAEDGARHAETRRIVNRGFTPRRIAALEPRIRTLTKELLAAHDPADFDLVRDLAVPLPVTIISELLGVETADRAAFKHWSNVILETSSTVAGRERRQQWAPDVADCFVDMFAYLGRVARERRRAPRDDLISTIVATQDGEMGLSDYDVMAFVVVLLVAGNETTTNLIGNAVNALLDHPEALAQLADEPERVGPALEELVRFESPVQLVFRTATRDVTLHGQRISKGATLAPLIGSANRDERRFADPDRLDLARSAQGHLGFGFGQHFCLGASLARLEARCALEAVVPQLGRYRRSDTTREWIDSFLVRGPASLRLARID